METLTIILAVVGIIAIVVGILFLFGWISTWKKFEEWDSGVAVSIFHSILLLIVFIIIFFKNIQL